MTLKEVGASGSGSDPPPPPAAGPAAAGAIAVTPKTSCSRLPSSAASRRLRPLISSTNSSIERAMLFSPHSIIEAHKASRGTKSPPTYAVNGSLGQLKAVDSGQLTGQAVNGAISQ